MLLDSFRHSCGWRRKSILNKLMPAVLQVFVVIGVWHLLKSREATVTKVDRRFSRSVNSDGDSFSPLCSPGEYATGDRLALDTIVSREDEGLLSKNPFQPLFLNVELFVRDAELGTLILYPAGTPVTLGGMLRKDTKDNTGDELVFFDDNNEDRFKDIVGESNKLLKQDFAENVQENKETARGQMELETALESGGTVHDKPNINKLLLEDEMLRVRPEDQRGQQEILEEVKDVGGMQNNDVAEMGLRHYQLKESVGIRAGQLSRAKITQRFVAVNDPYSDQNQELGQGKSTSLPVYMKQSTPPQNVQGRLTQAIGNSKILPMIGQDRKYDHDVKFTSNNPANRVTTSSYSNGPPYSTIHSPFAEGFVDRIKKFKYEYFGRYVNESHRTGSVATPYVIVNPQRCGFPEKIHILFLIHSLPQSSEQRQRIRDTFVASKFFQPYTISYVFLLGVGSSTFQTNLKHESLMYGDVVQGDFQDAPENAALKGLMGLRWVLEFCPQVDFVMKIDEGVFVDSDKLLNGMLPVVKKHVGKRSILCAFNPQGPIPRIGSNSFTPDMFPNRTALRPYCKGYAVILTQSLISSLVAAAKLTPLVYVEDFYLYGVLPFVVGGVDVYDLGNKRAFHDFGVEAVNCYENMGDKCPFVASKAYGDRFKSLWDMMRARMSQSVGKWDATSSLWHIPNYRRNF